MTTSAPEIRRYFRTRAILAAFCLGGFALCVERGLSPPSHAHAGRDDGGAGAEVMKKAAEFALSRDSEPGPASPVVTPPPDGQPAPGAAPAAPVMEPTVMIDAGHGGVDGGTQGNDLLEKDWALKVALSLAEELKRRKHKVELMRSGDDTVQLTERPPRVNAKPRIALLSVHFNAGTPDASGVETFYSWPKKPEVMARLRTEVNRTSVEPMEPVDTGDRLAAAIQAAVCDATGARDRGSKNREDMALTSRTLCPSVLIECGFVTNASESRRIQDADYRRKIVRGIADGFEHWLRECPPTPGPGLVDEMVTLPATAGGEAEH